MRDVSDGKNISLSFTYLYKKIILIILELIRLNCLRSLFIVIIGKSSVYLFSLKINYNRLICV